MRLKTVTERYNAVLEGTMAKREFVRQMRNEYPMHVTQFNGFDDSVQILKNRGLLFEAKKKKKKAKQYDDRPALTYSLDALGRIALKAPVSEFRRTIIELRFFFA